MPLKEKDNCIASCTRKTFLWAALAIWLFWTLLLPGYYLQILLFVISFFLFCQICLLLDSSDGNAGILLNRLLVKQTHCNVWCTAGKWQWNILKDAAVSLGWKCKRDLNLVEATPPSQKHFFTPFKRKIVNQMLQKLPHKVAWHLCWFEKLHFCDQKLLKHAKQNEKAETNILSVLKQNRPAIKKY